MLRSILVRTLDEANKTKVCFIGINPSTADIKSDDHTTTKLKEFTRRWGFGKYLLVNVYPYRATHVRDLRNHNMKPRDMMRNRQRILETINSVDLVVPMWGSRTKLPVSLRDEIDRVNSMLTYRCETPIMCLGLTASGDPGHPLRIAYDTPLQGYV